MRTKHLLSATALVALLAACNNEDFISNGQQNLTNDGRPTVSDVKLNFTQDDANTRLAFGSNGYAWEGDETIGALLMDNVQAGVKPSNGSTWETKTWLERYGLTSTIQTDYPFTYDATAKVWSCNTKMLEGNYFFAFPWEGYEGNRQVKHSLINQQQTGTEGKVVAESYAKNQFFIGYSQIKAGAEAKDALNDVNMTAVLGAIQLKIVNVGTQDYHINKIVLSGDGLLSALTFDPLSATYTNYNLTNPNGAFNYANYTNNQTDLYTSSGNYVYNADGGYDRKAALRAVVSSYPDANNEKYAQLIINGTKAERTIKRTEKEPTYALIMANAHKPKDGELMLSIYTDEALVQKIDLTKINNEGESVDEKGTPVTNAAVKEISPEVANTILVRIDNNSFTAPKDMEIQNSDDLLQFIKWNVQTNVMRQAKATLKKDVTFTKEMADLLKASPKCELTIDGANNLTIAADVDANLLTYANLTVETKTIVLGSFNLNADTKANAINVMTVEEGATLNISEASTYVVKTIMNHGTLNIAADVQIATSEGVSFHNYGVMNVEEGADVKATIYNGNAELNGNGYMEGAIYNNKDGKIVMGANGTLKSTGNNGGIITTVAGAKVTIATNSIAGVIEFVSGAKVAVTNQAGIVSWVASASLTADNTKEAATNNVNTLIVSATTNAAVDVASFTNIKMMDGGKLTTTTGKTITATKLTVSEKCKATVAGTVKATTVAVEKGATLALASNGSISGIATFTNNGSVENNGSVVLNQGVSITAGAGATWKYNIATNAVNPSQPTEYKFAVEIDGATSTGQTATNNGTCKFKTLAALDEFMKGDHGTDIYTIKDITISTNELALSDDEEEDNYYDYLKTYAAGKEVKLSADLTGLTNEMGLSFSKLTVTGAATVQGAISTSTTMLTVGKLDYKAAELTIANGYIQMSGSAQVGTGYDNITPDANKVNLVVTSGKLVIKSSQSTTAELLEWDATKLVWKTII